MKHFDEFRVYYADTDAYGVVWHGSYLRFCEQARCEFAATTSTSMKYLENNNILTPLVEVNIRYKTPAKVHDTLIIETTVDKLTPIRATMLQKITNKETGKEVATATVTFVCTDKEGNLYRKMPDAMYKMLETLCQ